MGAVSNRKPASAGISPEVQGRLPYFIDKSQRILIREDAGFLWDKASTLCYTMAETRSSTTLGMQCGSSFWFISKRLPLLRKLLSLVKQYKELRWSPRLQVATTCFSCSPPDLNFLDP